MDMLLTVDARKAAIAGSDIYESHVYVTELVSLKKRSGKKEAVIDDATRRIFVKFELGLFDDPYKYCDEVREASIGSKAHNDDARYIKKSIVSLKNEKIYYR
jgi:beta-glucosidase